MFSSLLAFASTAAATSSLAAQQQQQTEASNELSKSDEERSSSSVNRKSPAASPEDSQDYDTALGLHLLQRFARDQEQLWTFPGRVRVADADWLMPLALTTAFFIGTDTEFSKHLSNSPSRINNSTTFSNYGLGAMGAMAGGLYLWGQVTHDDHKRETGFLAGEAALNSLAAVYALKYTLGRERPLQDNYRGDFRSGGDSFPSEHAAAAWSIASVVAHEYPGTLTQILVYGMATAVSASRLTAKQHFPSDVLIGSAIGWVSGEVVYRAHHDPELGGSSWPTYSAARSYFESERPRQNMGTTFVELDSWVYPAFDRLGGLGYIHTAFQGERPWTRMQCALLIEEATDALLGREVAGDGASALVLRLRHEFSYEMERLDGGAEHDSRSGVHLYPRGVNQRASSNRWFSLRANNFVRLWPSVSARYESPGRRIIPRGSRPDRGVCARRVSARAWCSRAF